MSPSGGFRPIAPTRTSRWNSRGAIVAISAAIHPPKPSPISEARSTPRSDKQPLIDHRDVAHVAQPLRPLGLAIARMVRDQHVEMAGQLVIKREPVGTADIMVQHHDRAPAAGARQMQLRPGYLDDRLAPVLARRHRHPSRSSPNSSLAPRYRPPQPTVCSLQGCNLVSNQDHKSYLLVALRQHPGDRPRISTKLRRLDGVGEANARSYDGKCRRSPGGRG